MTKMASGNTFEFDQEAYERIIFKESLFGDDAIPDVGREDYKKKLTDLLDRETRLFLHAVTLSDYLRKKKIPRGLRILKAPAVGKPSPDFSQKWCEILNKCSFDLMVLIIQEMNDQLTEVRDEIKETRGKMEKDYMDKDALKTLLAECEQYKEKLHKELTIMKKEKFIRDTVDYEKDNVYKWKSDKPKRGANPQRTSQRGYSTAADTESDAYSSASTSSSFLDVRTTPQGNHSDPRTMAQRGARGKRGGRKNAGGGRGSMPQGYMDTSRETRSHSRETKSRNR